MWRLLLWGVLLGGVSRAEHGGFPSSLLAHRSSMLAASDTPDASLSEEALAAMAQRLEMFASVPAERDLNSGARDSEGHLVCPSLNCSMLFVHIPKTGGTTLLMGFIEHAKRHSLRLIRCMKYVTLETCTELLSPPPPPEAPITAAPSIPAARAGPSPQGPASLVLGHMPLFLNESAGRGLIMRDRFVITLLRDPVARLVSYYNWLQPELNFSSWYQFVRLRMCNLQVSYLAGLPSGPNYAYRANCTRVTEQHLEDAKRRLAQNVTLFGVHSQFADFAQALGCVFAWDDAARQTFGSAHIQPHAKGPPVDLATSSLSSSLSQGGEQGREHMPSDPYMQDSVSENPGHVTIDMLSKELLTMIRLDNALDVRLVRFAEEQWALFWPYLRKLMHRKCPHVVVPAASGASAILSAEEKSEQQRRTHEERLAILSSFRQRLEERLKGAH